MRAKLLSGVASSAVAAVLGGSLAGGALAADMPIKGPASAWSWTGFYAGVHDAAFGGSTKFSDPYGSSIFGDRASTPGYGFGGQIGYNRQLGNWVYGLEADATWLASNGTATCGAYSGYYISANCGARPDANGTVTGRIGLALGPAGHTLAYAKGGFAWQHTNVSAANNNTEFASLVVPQMSSASLTQAGWTVGAGIEQALTPAWSVKFEYDYLNFGHQGGVTIPGSAFLNPTGQAGTFSYTLAPPGAANVSSNVHMVKLGLNYKLGQDPWSAGFGTPGMAGAPGWAFEGGGRYWYSWGRFQKDMPAGPGSNQSLISRLTYDNMTGNTGEFFGRVDTPVNVFLKGYVGGGSVSSGRMNDEDWGLFDTVNFKTPVSYSNTISNSVTGPLFYGTIDLGYDFLRGPGYKAGAFVGYNRYDSTMNAGGCEQLANQFSDCKLGQASPTSQVVITERNTWDSLRIGASAETMLFDRWKVSGDVAYIPYTKFTGRDQHQLLGEVFDEQGHGQGVQTEAFLSYLVTDAFSIGVGGRYWAMWTTSGTDTFNGTVQQRNDTFRTERAGVTFQASYKFGTK
jgi:opacity protein-like surface antigen